MNYYEHHLGDYLRDTAHLSMLEDGAYRRLIDAYYIRGKALPAEKKDVYRLVRAVSKPERGAVDVLLAEFFSLADDGWHHSRCDREIARFLDKQRKAAASANARWNSCERNANALPTQCEGNALQSPVSSLQSPVKNKDSEKRERTPAARACALPSDFSLTDDRKAYAEKTLPNVDAPELMAAFRDYHASKGTTARDWDASWRTYVRNGLKFGYPMPVATPMQPKKVTRYDVKGNVIPEGVEYGSFGR